MPNAPKPARVAIIGGGPAGLTAALELTSGDRASLYDVTIYQQGWRLGGKCSSGRNQQRGYGQRIEEHGLHVWFGCYDNARHVVEQCYGELKEAGENYAFDSFDAAFEGIDYIVLGQRAGGRWAFNEICFPRNRRAPLNFGGFVGEALTWSARGMLRRAHPDLASTTDRGDEWWAQAWPVLRSLRLSEVEEGRRTDQLARGMSRLHRTLTSRSLNDSRFNVLSRRPRALERFNALHRPPRALERFADLAAAVLPERDDEPGEARFYRDTVHLLLAVLRGIWRDDLLSKGFDTINDQDLARWLVRHGLKLEQDPSDWPALLRAIYDGCFAFQEGDPQRPSMAAGRALQGAIRCLFHYRGSVLFRPRGSMSDVLIAPMACVLGRRNVKIRYLHAASSLRPDSEGRRVSEVDIVQQLPPSDDFAHTFSVEAGPLGGVVHSWSTSLPEDRLPESGADSRRLEYEINPFDGEVITLREDDPDHGFDWIVLAVPPGVQDDICQPLAAMDPNYAAMLRNAETVATQAAQLWLGPTAIELRQGFRADSLMSCFVEPLDTYADMAHITEHERWATDDQPVGHIAYLCGVLPHATIKNQREADAAASRELARFLREDAGALWPGGTVRGEKAFDLDLLVPKPSSASCEPLEHQYCRANWCATERYVLTPPGSIQHRLTARGTRFENLVLAGDWTANGFDAGCLEAAVTSGRLAAQAICGFPLADDIPGVNGPPGFPNAVAPGARRPGLSRLLRMGSGLWRGVDALRRVTVDNIWTRHR